MRRIIVLVAVVAGMVSACTERFAEPEPENWGLNYYPISVGDYRIYNVTDIVYRRNVGDTSVFQLREVVADTFRDQTNTLNYKIIRSIRLNKNAAWEEDSVITAVKTDQYVQEMQDNTKRLKLVFPVMNGKAWEGDAFNANMDANGQKEEYRYEKVGEPFTLAGTTYENSLTIIQGAPSKSLVALDDRKEVYAQDIGMVYRMFTRIKYCDTPDTQDCNLGEDYKLDGHERIEVLDSHGKL